MKYCVKCGNQLAHSAEYCPKCGNRSKAEYVPAGNQQQSRSYTSSTSTAAPGKNFLLVVGILYIIFGGIYIIISAIGLSTANYWDTILPTANNMSWSVYYTISLIGSFWYVFIGIMGVTNRTRLERASLLRVLACVDFGYILLHAILGFVIFSGALGGITAVYTLVVGLVLPILYLVGAQKNYTRFMGR